jgi:hypothetical protein
MAQSNAEPSPAITDPEAYQVYAAILPRSVLDENHRGPIAIQIETAPRPGGLPACGFDYRRGAPPLRTIESRMPQQSSFVQVSTSERRTHWLRGRTSDKC